MGQILQDQQTYGTSGMMEGNRKKIEMKEKSKRKKKTKKKEKEEVNLKINLKKKVEDRRAQIPNEQIQTRKGSFWFSKNEGQRD